MKTKRAHCSSCSNGSNHPIWEAAIRFDADANKVPVWECRCCHQTMPRRVLAKKLTAVGDLMASGRDYTFEELLAATRTDRLG